MVHIHTIGFVALDREKESLDSEKETKTYEQEASVSWRETFGSYVLSVKSRGNNATHERKFECFGWGDRFAAIWNSLDEKRTFSRRSTLTAQRQRQLET